MLTALTDVQTIAVTISIGFDEFAIVTSRRVAVSMPLPSESTFNVWVKIACINDPVDKGVERVVYNFLFDRNYWSRDMVLKQIHWTQMSDSSNPKEAAMYESMKLCAAQETTRIHVTVCDSTNQLHMSHVV